MANNDRIYNIYDLYYKYNNTNQNMFNILKINEFIEVLNIYKKDFNYNIILLLNQNMNNNFDLMNKDICNFLINILNKEITEDDFNIRKSNILNKYSYILDNININFMLNNYYINNIKDITINYNYEDDNKNNYIIDRLNELKNNTFCFDFNKIKSRLFLYSYNLLLYGYVDIKSNRGITDLFNHLSKITSDEYNLYINNLERRNKILSNKKSTDPNRFVYNAINKYGIDKLKGVVEMVSLHGITKTFINN